MNEQPNISTGSTPTPAGSTSPAPKPWRTPPQPFDVINVPGALLKLQTLAALSGRSIATLYREASAGRLALVKTGARCTRVTSEAARAYLELLAKGSV